MVGAGAIPKRGAQVPRLPASSRRGQRGSAGLVKSKRGTAGREQGELQQQRRRWQEQEHLWGEGRTPRPHAEIDLVVEELGRLEVTAQAGSRAAQKLSRGGAAADAKRAALAPVCRGGRAGPA